MLGCSMQLTWGFSRQIYALLNKNDGESDVAEIVWVTKKKCEMEDIWVMICVYMYAYIYMYIYIYV